MLLLQEASSLKFHSMALVMFELVSPLCLFRFFVFGLKRDYLRANNSSHIILYIDADYFSVEIVTPTIISVMCKEGNVLVYLLPSSDSLQSNIVPTGFYWRPFNFMAIRHFLLFLIRKSLQN